MHIFTYGSLMFPPIWQRVVRGHYRSATATLSAYARYALRDDSYPGMVAQPDSVVEGVLYYDVDAQDVAELDRFEGHEYRREEVNVVIESGASVIACTYIFLAEQRLSGLPWEPQGFRLSRFIDTYIEAEASADSSDKLGG
ncbi:AIG2-like family protein [compost metagenome]